MEKSLEFYIYFYITTKYYTLQYITACIILNMENNQLTTNQPATQPAIQPNIYHSSIVKITTILHLKLPTLYCLLFFVLYKYNILYFFIFLVCFCQLVGVIFKLSMCNLSHIHFLFFYFTTTCRCNTTTTMKKNKYIVNLKFSSIVAIFRLCQIA